jgi:hypothetical protein
MVRLSNIVNPWTMLNAKLVAIHNPLTTSRDCSRCENITDAAVAF